MVGSDTIPPSQVVRSYAAPPHERGADEAVDVSVVLPAWDEAASLRVLVPKLRELLDEARLTHECIVVVPAAGDPSADAVAGVQVLVQREPGYGGALAIGLATAQGRSVVSMDADGSHDPAVVLPLLRALDLADVAVASRLVEGGGSDAPRFRRLLTRVACWVFRRRFRLPVRDVTSGFRAYRREALAQMDFHCSGYDAVPELLVLGHQAGLRFREVPLQYTDRRNGTSHAPILRTGLGYLAMLRRLRRRPPAAAAADPDQAEA